MQFEIVINVFCHAFHMFLGESKETLTAFAEQTDEEDKDFFDDKDGYIDGNLIWIKNPMDVGAVAHELSHATCAVIETHGLPEHTEVRAYILGYLIDEYYRLIDEHRCEKCNHVFEEMVDKVCKKCCPTVTHADFGPSA